MTFDPLFEFDAPKTFVDLSAPLAPHAPGEHDPWFDDLHPDHSRPSEELARELAEKVRKLQEKEQLKNSRHNKENQRPADWRELVAARNKQLKQEKSKKYTSLKEMRATHEPFKMHKTKTDVKQAPNSTSRKRKPLVDVGNRLSKRKPTDEMKLEALLKKHNKKFKATHTYEPPQHSVREVKQWERATKKSYYALSADERVEANQEIAVWKQRRLERSH